MIPTPLGARLEQAHDRSAHACATFCDDFVTPRVRPASSDQTDCRRLSHCCLTRRRDHESRTSQEDPEFVEIPLILSSYRPQIPSPE